ncbi:RNA 2',3'-cyclic phosphodiesterase [Allorhodopirellula heiligendammensis]|nr:RNA 2',3'-cyclic phosphodiesterase [Allorhodopirellula heiligendammensis]|tara:strand:+ start:1041 stop:1688 length:648 start_codon:yes stop_codon:yes gene_type:complete
MKTIRTFLAIPLPPPLARCASKWIHEMKDGAEKLSRPTEKNPTVNRSPVSPETPVSAMGIKWVPEDNLHLTLKFLGEVDNVEVPQVCDIVEAVCEPLDPFVLNFVGAGFLPDKDRARILSVTIEDPTDSLTKIVSELEDRFADIGFKREPRDYVPHLTLGRARSGSRRLSQTAIDRWSLHEDDPLGEMTVDCVQVIGSFLEKRGPTYNVMDTVEF